MYSFYTVAFVFGQAGNVIQWMLDLMLFLGSISVAYVYYKVCILSLHFIVIIAHAVFQLAVQSISICWKLYPYLDFNLCLHQHCDSYSNDECCFFVVFPYPSVGCLYWLCCNEFA